MNGLWNELLIAAHGVWRRRWIALGVAWGLALVGWLVIAPAVFDRADDFVIDARRQPHLSFGGGSHICIGAPLARLEGQISLLKLFQRFPALRIVDPQAEPKWRTLPFFRGLEELIVAA